jgi:hypothetical protein
MSRSQRPQDVVENSLWVELMKMNFENRALNHFTVMIRGDIVHKVLDKLETIGFQRRYAESPFKNFPVYDQTGKNLIETDDVKAGEKI